MDADIIAALNGLLEEERADAEALVGLVAMATDTFERQALTAMGGQAAQGCIDLHDRLARLSAPISGRVSSSVTQMLRPERIDDRLRTFAEVQRHLAGRCEALQARNLDDETRALLAALRSVQLVHAEWAEHRADEFAATRPSEVESSSPSHAVPQDEYLAEPGAETAETTTTATPAVNDEDGVAILADNAFAEDAPTPDLQEHSGGMNITSAVDEPASVEPPPETTAASVLEPARPDVPLDGVGEAPATPAAKPRVRRSRVGAQPAPRRTSKKL